MVKALSEFNVVAYVNIFIAPSDYDEIPLCKILYLSEVWDCWRNKSNGNAQ
jgi:hypothetical protein